MQAIVYSWALFWIDFFEMQAVTMYVCIGGVSDLDTEADVETSS